MIKANFNTYSSYVTDSLYQWDLNQVLTVNGLNLAVAPEVHFSNSKMDKAIVRQAVMENHVVSVGIPNSLLQDPLTIRAHIGIYEDNTFKVIELVEIPVIAKARPTDYQIEDKDGEVYSFNALLNHIANMTTLEKHNSDKKILNARIDAIIANNNNTSGNSELVDIRVDADGKKQGSAGAAVRGQILDLRKNHIKPNLLDIKKVSPGYLHAYGVATAQSLKHVEYYSDYIPVDNTLPYYWHVDHSVESTEQPWVGFCTYDKDFNFIERLSWHVNERAIDFSDNVAYVRISFRSLLLCKAKFEQSTYPTAIEDTESLNLYEKYPLAMPGYVASGGFINTPTPEGYIGVEGITLNEKFSVMIPVTEGDTYIFYNGATLYPWLAVGFYDVSGAFVERYTFDVGEHEYNTVIVPEGAVAMRYSARTYTQHSFIVYKKTGVNDYLEEYLKLKTATDTVVYNPATAFVKGVAHRGYSSEAPENTLPAYRLARAKGFEYAECDISFTSDGVPVLLHDDTIDRTSDGSGNVADMTYEELSLYDFGSWFSDKFVGTKIPTFGQFLLLCRNIGLKPYVELKAGTEEQIKGLVQSAKEFGILDSITWISFNINYLSYVLSVNPSARVGYIISAINTEKINAAESLRTETNTVFIDSANYTADEVTLCVNAGIPLEIWTVNSATTIQNLPYYVSGVTSDTHNAGEVLSDYSMN
jgi:glycerophosphoryl diester phosphodiesterase